MGWTKEEEIYLSKSYSTRAPLEDISRHLNKTIKSIKNKADRLGIVRPRKPFDIDKLRKRQKRANDNYYRKNKKEMYLRKRKRLREKKEYLVNFLGGKCKNCGYNKCLAALEFHHNTPNKEGNIAQIIKDYSKQKALKEIKSCILLCANCHREAHHKGL